MQLSEYLAQADALALDARAVLDGLEPDTRLDVAKGQLNARKDDRLAALQGALRELPAGDRRAAGTAFNTLKQDIQKALEVFVARQTSVAGASSFDATMPARGVYVPGLAARMALIVSTVRWPATSTGLRPVLG